MTEDFLHYIWKHRLYKPGQYFSNQGEQLEIINPGLLNSDAGPDFFNAKIKIGDTMWAGNIEIHLKASDWFKHGHHQDEAYNNVILHVVAENNSTCFNASQREIPVWEIPIETALTHKYMELQQNQLWVPCAEDIKQIDEFHLGQWLERMTIEKLEMKVDSVIKLLSQYNNDWDEVFYVLLVRNFGFGLNGDPFEMLARRTPWRTILKNADNIERLEAIFLGQGGFLSDLLPEDEYIQKLQKEYKLLSAKYGLTPIESHTWKFLRLRPSNFPTIRLVQLAELFNKGRLSLSKVLKAETTQQLIALLNISPSGYWMNHYRPGAESPVKSKAIGQNSRELIIINTFVPLAFAYGKLRGNEEFCSKSTGWLESLKPESNTIIEKWEETGIQARNAAQSQALVHLKKRYCREKKCLMCRIGHLIISGKTNPQ
ncbi:DUF2851 family protein [Alkalitalea saponilacus]|uniref:DUF2851 domain-containing protein n=1 Tax=Alkalitalea saponilacus TaxID=889453 RepID=A0A1T5HET5_9BACT|nr:DUF2851 family protein [Alkalitalea saponilacus]ASB48083.1 hypothetical protein CDL62_02450 [Alkalitalea saponilacus]SKC19207.1 Protein of unknown function [Alkalitalea saponilacus]